MDFPDLVTVVEYATILVTFILIGSGFPVCLNMYKQKSAANVPYLLFLVSALVSVLSLQYGILISNKTVILINIVAVLVWGLYISTYILVSQSKATPILKLLAIVGLYWAHVLHLQAQPSSEVIPTLGSYLIVWCTICCVVPAGDIVKMVQDKSSDCCDLPLLCGGTLSAAIWYLYGFLLNDFNIYFPSIPALLVSSIKFGLLFLYGCPSKKTEEIGAQKTKDASKKNDFHKDVFKAGSREDLRYRN